MKVSVVIPVFNEAKIIVETLQQFQALRGSDLEIIVSDDKSTDETVALARPFADKVIERIGQHTTIGNTRNQGAQAAGGDILWFIDAEVHIPQLREVYTMIQDRFTTNPALMGLTLHSQIYPPEETLVDRTIFWCINRIFQFQNNVLHQGAASGECQIVRRTAFEQIEGYSHILTTTEDHDLFVRLANIGQTRYLWNYRYYTSPRRFRHDGWPKVLGQWLSQYINWFILKRPNQTPWLPRR